VHSDFLQRVSIAQLRTALYCHVLKLCYKDLTDHQTIKATYSLVPVGFWHQRSWRHSNGVIFNWGQAGGL